MRVCTRWVIAIVAGLMVTTLSGQTSDLTDIDDAFERDVLIIQTTRTGCFRFDIYLAVTGKQQRRGLMFVRHLPEFAGMIFLYRKAGIRSMWMKNTLIPLDMVFARGDGSVTSIMADTEPLSLKSISSTEPVNYVLEINAGMAARIGIDRGSLLIMDLQAAQ